MDKTKLTDEELTKKLQQYEKECSDFLQWTPTTRSELSDIIEYLIEHRQALKEKELRRLEMESEGLLEKLRELDKQKLIEELHCFKEILTFHKVLLEDNGQPPD